MAQAQFKIFDDSRVVFASSLEESEQDDIFSFSGRLLRELVVEVQTLSTLHLSMSTRSGSATITLVYQVAGTTVYQITPGRPLVLQTSTTTEDEQLLSLTVTQIGPEPPDMEILVYPGSTTPPPIVPTDAILVLDTFSGFVVGPGNILESWEDIRDDSGAPGQFLPIGEDVIRNPSNPLFNDQPTMSWSEFTQAQGEVVPGDRRLVSQDPDNVFDFLIKGGDIGGGFTVAMICNSIDGYDGFTLSNETLAGAGFSVHVDPGFRRGARMRNNTGATVNNGLDLAEETPLAESLAQDSISLPTVVIITFDGVTLTILSRGRTTTATLLGPPVGTEADGPLFIGGNFLGGLFQGDIADIRLWDRVINTNEQNGYLLYAADTFGASSEVHAQAPIDQLEWMIRANRGVDLDDNGTVVFLEAWRDTRPETLVTGDFVVPPEKQNPLRNQSATYNFKRTVSFSTSGTPGRGMEYTGPLSHFEKLGAVANATWVMVVEFGGDRSTTSAPIIDQGQTGIPATPGFQITVGGAVTNDAIVSARVVKGSSTLGSATTAQTVTTPQTGLFFMDVGPTPGNGHVAIVWRGTNDAVANFVEFQSDTPDPPTASLNLGNRFLSDPDANARGFLILECRMYGKILSSEERDLYAAYVLDRYGLDVLPEP